MQNTTNSNYERGSVWRKWDLHIHTPCSLNQQYGGDTEEAWESFITDLESLPKSFKVIGINDYIFLDGYEKILIYKKKGRLSNIDLILPVVELRIDKFGSLGDTAWKKVNFHIIFSNEIQADIINQQFLSAIFHTHTLSPNHEQLNFSGIITKDSLIDFGQKIKKSSSCNINESDISVGFNNITYSYEKIIKVLESSYFTGKFITAIGKTEWDSLRWDGSIAAKKTIINKANLVFISSESPESYIKAKEKLIHEHVNTNLIDCSDAHCLSHSKDSNGKFIKDRIGKCFTWIKADPTFEGLKQIIFEPQERVRIQANNPEYDFNKPYFDRISIKNEDPIPVYDDGKLKIAQNEIKLNKNLVAIIGGRGDGKSTIINYMANCFGKITLNDTNFTNHDSFEVEYQKINEININPDDKINYIASEKLNNHLDFVFISQGQLKSKLQRPDDLSNTLKELLLIHEKGFSKVLENEIYSVNEQIASLEKWKLQKDEQNELINSQAFHQRVVDVNSTLLNGLKNSQNKLNIEKYNVNLTKFSNLQKEINLAYDILNKINTFTQEISSLIEKNNLDNPTYSLPDFSSYQSGINLHVQDLEKQASNIKTQNESIKTDLLDRGVSGDLTSLLTNIEKYQNIIKNSELKKLEINQKDIELNRLKSLRSEFGNKIKLDYENQKNNIDDGWEKFLSRHDESNKKLINDIILSDKKINITGKINFNLEEFYKLLSESLNKNTYKDVDELKSQYKIKSLDDLSNFIENEFNAKLDLLNHKKQEFIDLFFSTKKRSAYLKTEADIKYDGKYLNQLSAGQKGTAYLRIQLANSAFSTPIIFDQPEDDLDNKFIVGELINIFKELKKYRQIIIVTHNANLVVNADAEQVIVAQNENETLSYISGSLEDTKIQQHVCDILEGGVTAFEKRKNKYNLK